LITCRTPIRSAISRSLARLAAKERPTKRSPRSFSIPCCQRRALKPSRSKIPASSFEIEAFPSRKSRPIYSTRMPCEHSATRSDTTAPQAHQPIWIARSPSRKSPGGATLLHAIPVDSSRSCSLCVVKNHHRDRSSQHYPRARVVESACHFSLSLWPNRNPHLAATEKEGAQQVRQRSERLSKGTARWLRTLRPGSLDSALNG
jgi:hypothetical protein